jgi:heme exporter protein C
MIPTLDEARATTRRGLAITALALAGVAAVICMALWMTPTEVRQGLAQKIFYLHAPSAWAGLMAFSLTGITGGLYLWLRDPRLDLFAEASAEVGLVFGTIVLTTGPIWGKPIWGAWWTWDARLTLTLFIFFLFIGYMPEAES